MGEMGWVCDTHPARLAFFVLYEVGLPAASARLCAPAERIAIRLRRLRLHSNDEKRAKGKNVAAPAPTPAASTRQLRRECRA